MMKVKAGDTVDINRIQFIAVNPLQEDSCLGCELDGLAGNLMGSRAFTLMRNLTDTDM